MSRGGLGPWRVGAGDERMQVHAAATETRDRASRRNRPRCVRISLAGVRDFHRRVSRRPRIALERSGCVRESPGSVREG